MIVSGCQCGVIRGAVAPKGTDDLCFVSKFLNALPLFTKSRRKSILVWLLGLDLESWGLNVNLWAGIWVSRLNIRPEVGPKFQAFFLELTHAQETH